MHNKEKHTARDGRRYEIDLVSTNVAPNGMPVTTGYLVMDNPATGHGWGGVITLAEWQDIKSR